MSDAKRMLAAFEGSSDGHGKTIVGRATRSGKTEAQSRVVREPLTEELVRSHLDGKAGIGSIPINRDNKCKFGALDIDSYDLDLAGLAKQVAALKLPLFVCRSKSGGGHLFLFLKDWEPAGLIREYLAEMSVVLGYSGCEIFPKQDKILSERGDVGNFINMPYFNADMTTRYCLDSNGEAMTLDQFLSAVEKGKTTAHELNALNFAGERKFFTDGPYCLEVIASKGPITENRNTTLFNIGRYCQKKWRDDWKRHMEEYNRMLCSPPLDAAEVVAIQASLLKKDYGFQCNQCPLKDHCDKNICRTRPFGVGGDAEDASHLGGLTILLSEPRLYFMDVDGNRIQLSTEQLQNPSLWQRACMEQMQRMPPTPKPAKWQQLVNELMKNSTQLEVAEELTISGQFKEHLRDYCTSRIRAMVPEELIMGKPYTDGGVTKFTMAGLGMFLKNRGFMNYTRAQIQEQIKRINGNDHCSGHQSIKKDNGKFTTIRVWWVPAFDESEIELPRMEVSNDVPF
jgi:hypothetical protein